MPTVKNDDGGSEALVGALLLAGTVGLARWMSGRERVEQEKVLLVGDAVGAALAAPLGAHALAAAVPFDAACKSGTRVTQWSSLPPLRERIASSGAQVVLAALGTADEATPVPEQLAAIDSLRQLVERRMGGRLYWVTPLVSGGFADSLKSVLPGKRIYDARRVLVPRTPDGAPTARGAVGLAGAVWRWLR
jgi:dienelactone hydrolase